MGANVRVGLEDNLFLGPGVKATSNAEQVSKIRRILEELSFEDRHPFGSQGDVAVERRRRMSSLPECQECYPAIGKKLQRKGTSTMTFHDRLYPPKGLRVLVTAGASGIGAAIASAFAETGAEIHICDIDDAALAAFTKVFLRARRPTRMWPMKRRVAALFETQRARFGGLDVLVNCAGDRGAYSGWWRRLPSRSGSAPSTSI